MKLILDVGPCHVVVFFLETEVTILRKEGGTDLAMPEDRELAANASNGKIETCFCHSH